MLKSISADGTTYNQSNMALAELSQESINFKKDVKLDAEEIKAKDAKPISDAASTKSIIPKGVNVEEVKDLNIPEVTTKTTTVVKDGLEAPKGSDASTLPLADVAKAIIPTLEALKNTVYKGDLAPAAKVIKDAPIKTMAAKVTSDPASKDSVAPMLQKDSKVISAPTSKDSVAPKAEKDAKVISASASKASVAPKVDLDGKDSVVPKVEESSKNTKALKVKVAPKDAKAPNAVKGIA